MTVHAILMHPLHFAPGLPPCDDQALAYVPLSEGELRAMWCRWILAFRCAFVRKKKTGWRRVLHVG